jgi:hypothetical protein
MENETEPELSDPQDDTAIECQCTCQGECTCGNKYISIRPVFYEVDVNQVLNALDDWD